MLEVLSSRTDLNVLQLAPPIAMCPRCGAPCPRNEIRRLKRQDASLEQPRTVELGLGCYLCPDCPEGSRWFRLEPLGFEGRSAYTSRTRAMVLSLVTVHKLSFDGAAAVGRSLLHLPDLHGTTVMRWFRQAADEVDYQGHLAKMAEVFSGQLAIDEVYDGQFFIIKATDPLNGVEITSWLGDGSPTEDDIRQLLLELKEAGICPELVVTDGSRLYPNVITEVFPEAKHQRCVFHFLKRALELLTPAFHQAVRDMPQPPKRKRGRPKKRGRPRKDKVKRENIKKVRRCRYLVFKRAGLDRKGRPLFSPWEEKTLAQGMAQSASLRRLRAFVEQLYELFGPTTDSRELANRRREALLQDPSFGEDDNIAKVLRQLSDEALFEKLTNYLLFENADKTSNHPERENREFRRRQRSHYRLRSVVSMCSFLDLHLSRRTAPSPSRRLRRRPTEAGQTQEVTAA